MEPTEKYLVNASSLFIGTSGWTYDHWKGDFYPAGLAKTRWFDYYAARFNAVEVNATFYRPFSDQTYLKWKDRAPDGFRYVLKVPRSISHDRLLRNVEHEIHEFSRSADLLGDAFEMFLLQIAPSQPYDPGLLRSALQAFSDPSRVAVEFRAWQWFTPEVETVLTGLGAVWCNADYPGHPLTEKLTSARAYLRLHGRERMYASGYSDAELAETADLVRRLATRGAQRVSIFFNNDVGGYAPRDAGKLAANLGQDLARTDLRQNKLPDID